MYTLLIRLMVIAALIKLGLLAKGWVGPKDIQRASLEMIKMDWKPISEFPEEAKRFQR